MSDQKPTVVLVHGACADASSWTGVVHSCTSWTQMPPIDNLN